jgi:UDP-3-O-[3-hydroxymyristoyl] glucosamine N-acyltransferase
MNKYKLRKDLSIEHYGRTLYRIEALKSFNNVSVGDLGGYIESESNLSPSNDCWVYCNAEVYGNAYVCGNARLCGNVYVYGNARLCGNARVYGNAVVYGNAYVCGNARVYDSAIVYDSAEVDGNAEVYGNATVYGNAGVYGNAKVYDNAIVYDSARVYGNARVYDSARVYDNVIITKDPIYITGLPKHNIFITDNQVAIGCEIHTFKHWIKHIEDIGKQHKYTEAQIKLYKLVVFQCIETRTNKQLIKVV